MPLDPKVIHLIQRVQSNDPTIDTLYMRDCNIGGAGAKALAGVLERNRTITTLDLSGNDIGDAGATALAGALARNTTVTTLNLNGNHIGDAGAEALAGALELNHAITTLNLSSNNIRAAEAVTLARALARNTTVTTLELSCNDIGDEGATALAEALELNHAITTLHLWWNHIGDAGATALAGALARNTTVTTLNLNGNHIGDAGAEALAGALARNTTVITLHLPSNHIETAGATALARALERNSTLTTLNLWNNAIGVTGVIALAKALESNHTVTTLNLWDKGGALKTAIKEKITRNRGYVNKLIKAIRAGVIATINSLLTMGVSINKILGNWSGYDGYSPMMIACQEGNIDVIKALLPYWHNKKEQCTRADSSPDHGKTALDFAELRVDNPEIARLIKEAEQRTQIQTILAMSQEELRNLQGLNLRLYAEEFTQLSRDDFPLLILALARCTKLNNVCLRFDSATFMQKKDEFNTLFDSLQHLNIQAITIHCKDLGTLDEDGFARLQAALLQQKNLLTLDLSVNHLDELPIVQLGKFFNILQECTKRTIGENNRDQGLKRLILRHNNLSKLQDECWQLLCNFVLTTPSLQELDLSYNGLSEEQKKLLGSKVVEHNKLTISDVICFCWQVSKVRPSETNPANEQPVTLGSLCADEVKEIIVRVNDADKKTSPRDIQLPRIKPYSDVRQEITMLMH